MPIHWIIQQNLIRTQELIQLQQAFAQTQTSFEEVYVIPFSEQLPDFQHTNLPIIFYGSTTLIANAWKHPVWRKGIFYDPDTFQMPNYLTQWGNRMLNADMQFLSLTDFLHSYPATNTSWFVRPTDDSKVFSGLLMSVAELADWHTRLTQTPMQDLTPDTILCFATPKPIIKEWRAFVVNQQVVSACRYMQDGEKNISTTDVPSEMITFVQDCSQVYVPHPIFVMDIALCNDTYYILECNCFNDTGFYQHDIQAIVQKVNDFCIQAFTDYK